MKQALRPAGQQQQQQGGPGCSGVLRSAGGPPACAPAQQQRLRRCAAWRARRARSLSLGCLKAACVPCTPTLQAPHENRLRWFLFSFGFRRCSSHPPGTNYEVSEVGLLAPEPTPTGELLTGQVRPATPMRALSERPAFQANGRGGCSAEGEARLSSCPGCCNAGSMCCHARLASNLCAAAAAAAAVAASCCHRSATCWLA